MFKSTYEDIIWLKKNLRLNNYIAASSLYLKSNFWLEKPLEKEDIKNRIIGHWGTVPGLNLIYAGLNWLNYNLENIENQERKMLLVVGPGHGSPAILSNLWLEGSLGKYYPQYASTLSGAENLIKHFSWPGGLPSHTYPGLPGGIHEGGELGYSLGLAFGSIIENPNLVTVCVVGDGEAETGALAASWHSNKFINHETDGAVLSILHLNDYKISGPTIFSRMSDDKLFKYFEALNYQPFLVTQPENTDLNSDEDNQSFERLKPDQNPSWLNSYLDTLALAYQQVLDYKSGKSDKLPVLLLRTIKGWTGPKYSGGAKIEGNNLSHGIPLKNPKNNQTELQDLQNWLASYKVQELIDLSSNSVKPEVTVNYPSPENRLGSYQQILSRPLQPLNLPLPENLNNLQIQTLVPGQNGNQMVHVSKFLSQIVELNPYHFKIFSPDESESNRLESVFEKTNRIFNLPLKTWDNNLGQNGQMMEMLSEQTLQSWMQGFNAIGGSSILVSYEAFLAIIISQIDQYIKYLHQSLQFTWRGNRPSLNYIATSSLWRQDHNGFTHQNPILINTLLSKHVDFTNVYFPADVNTGLEVLQKVLQSQNTVNLIVAGKTDLPQWLNVEQAKTQVQQGIMAWDFASNYSKNSQNEVKQTENNLETNLQNLEGLDIILASAGDYQTLETLAAIDWLKQNLPELTFRYVNICQVNCFGLGCGKSLADQEEMYETIFGTSTPILINFHGYPEAIKAVLYDSSLANRTKVLGYIEQGSTTTPFDMQVLNKTSRWHIALQAMQIAAKQNSKIGEKLNKLSSQLESKLDQHHKYIRENGQDVPEVLNWEWEG